MKVVSQTWDLSVANGPPPGFARDQVIYAMWHDTVLGTPGLFRVFAPERKTTVLTSASKDGAALAEAMAVFRLGSVRGSSSRRGAQALRELLKLAKSGESLAVTPDGPRGPRHEVQEGILKLAQLTGLPIVPFQLKPQRALRFKTWDRLMLPPPFAKVTFAFGETLQVPRNASEEEMATLQDRLKTELGIYP